MKKTFYVFAVLGILSCSQVVFGYGKLGITLGSPWLGCKYAFTGHIKSELRFVIDPEVKINSLRAYYDLDTGKFISPFAGLEYGMITFGSQDISGSGTQVSAFIGGEHQLSNKLGLSMDIEYSSINLKAGDFSVEGPEYIFNISLNYYIK